MKLDLISGERIEFFDRLEVSIQSETLFSESLYGIRSKTEGVLLKSVRDFFLDLKIRMNFFGGFSDFILKFQGFFQFFRSSPFLPDSSYVIAKFIVFSCHFLW